MKLINLFINKRNEEIKMEIQKRLTRRLMPVTLQREIAMAELERASSPR
jgi:hypothetical protein